MENYPIAIVGGGPVGLFLACRLAQLGIDVCLLEKDAQRLIHSRSIGIHPPSLAYFDQLGLLSTLLIQGHQVKRGLAYANRRRLGEIDFSLLSPPYNFILTLPQHQTEAILEGCFEAFGLGAVKRRRRVTQLIQRDQNVEIHCVDSENNPEILQARYVVGCDGKQSIVRSEMQVKFVGGTYPDAYLMGDFDDLPSQGPDAAVYLSDEGLVESFPLPLRIRRWVVRTDKIIEPPSVEILCKMVEDRVGVLPDARSNSMLSAFGVQHYLADKFVSGNLILAGDAAHILSPIGGQGMNLGWLDAWMLASAFQSIFRGSIRGAAALEDYAKLRRSSAQAAIKRAALNMRMGAKSAWSPLRNVVLKGLINSPFQKKLAERFTMKNL